MSSMVNKLYDVVVIGGGVAGLSAAVECCAAGKSVLLVEQKPHFGGRTYSFHHKETGDDVDNGQHLMMGCYFSTLKFLRRIDALGKITIQKSLSIIFRKEGNRQFPLLAAFLPSPLHILFALLRLKSLSLKNRLLLLRVGVVLMFIKPEKSSTLRSLTVTQWLEKLHQPEENKKYLWNIIAIGALNDLPEKISAALFAKVLKTAFFWRRKNSSMVLPKEGLSSVFVDPAVQYIQKHGGEVRTSLGVKKIVLQNNAVLEIMLENGEQIFPRTVISTIPYFDVTKIFSEEQIALFSQFKNLDTFISSPIVTIHLWFDKHFMPEQFTALLDSPLHWVFNKTKMYEKTDSQLMYLAIVISSAFQFLPQSKEEIVALAQNELKKFYPESSSAAIIHSLVIKEKRATFSPFVGMERVRPSHTTSIENLFLAGDWTDTKLPATIEGAIQSGHMCAAHAIQKLL